MIAAPALEFITVEKEALAAKDAEIASLRRVIECAASMLCNGEQYGAAHLLSVAENDLPAAMRAIEEREQELEEHARARLGFYPSEYLKESDHV